HGQEKWGMFSLFVEGPTMLFTFLKRIGMAALAALMLWAWTTPETQAQSSTTKTPNVNVNLQVNPLARGFGTVPVSNPKTVNNITYAPTATIGSTVGTPAYGGFNPYGGGTLMNTTNPGYDPYGYPWYSYPDPYRGYLSGAADVINAQGRFAVSQQEALYKREQVRQARMDTRRKIWEQWLWERQHRPTPNDELRRLEEAEAERAPNFAPMPEIWSGKALNDLLRDLQKLQAKGPLPSVSLDQDTLDQINVTTGTGGNAGLLKSE